MLVQTYELTNAWPRAHVGSSTTYLFFNGADMTAGAIECSLTRRTKSSLTMNAWSGHDAAITWPLILELLSHFPVLSSRMERDAWLSVANTQLAWIAFLWRSIKQLCWPTVSSYWRARQVSFLCLALVVSIGRFLLLDDRL